MSRSVLWPGESRASPRWTNQPVDDRQAQKPSAPTTAQPSSTVFHEPSGDKADPSRGEGSHSPSGPSLSLPCRMVTKKKEKGRGGKKLLLRQHNPTECLSVNDKCEKKKKIFAVSYFGKAYFLRG